MTDKKIIIKNLKRLNPKQIKRIVKLVLDLLETNKIFPKVGK